MENFFSISSAKMQRVEYLLQVGDVMIIGSHVRMASGATLHFPPSHPTHPMEIQWRYNSRVNNL